MINKNAQEQLMQYYSIWRESNVMYENWAKAHDISYNHMLVWYALSDSTVACTQKTISRQWLLPKQSVNTILKEMEKQGYIVFTQADTDKRNKLIQLTEAGNEKLQKIILPLKKLEIDSIQKMGEQKMQGVIEGLTLYAQYFQKGIQ